MMYDKYTLNRCDAMEWLAEHYLVFPDKMPDVPLKADWCSANLFMGWGFVILLDGTLVFADCLSPPIRAEDMAGFKLPDLV
ncbi:hypothetical protein RZR38_19030 [Citrobacter freundii]|nr:MULTISPECIES: hypothetical protein [Enterobacteriaceae]HDS5360622.1 hypothetical protein [Enterobacter roggenkampii]MBW9387898.1 hypothetical protein [Enterobacter sp. EC_62]MCJ8538922.1 hypothetical protein [Enterobacter cloacae]MDU2080078.1 hypothetical protein [Enterobacter sp.]MDV1857864.1 hypothetical protein [Citrobacter freundii]